MSLDVSNYHSQNDYPFSYFECPVEIEGKIYYVELDVKQRAGSNHFRVHYVSETKMSQSGSGKHTNGIPYLNQKGSTDRINQKADNVKHSEKVGYHAGDLGKSEPLSRMDGGRGTGHFGTGTYFVGDPEKIKGYNKRENKLYLVITLNEIEKASVIGQALSKDNPKSWDAFEVSVLDIIKNVKSSDGAFLKYIPDEL